MTVTHITTILDNFAKISLIISRTDLFDSGCGITSSSSNASSAGSNIPKNDKEKNNSILLYIYIIEQINNTICIKNSISPVSSLLAYVSGRMRSIGTPRSTSVRTSCL